MGIFSLVDCDEVFGSRVENLSATERSASVDLQVSWANHAALMQDLIWNHRPWPDDAMIYATKVSSKPMESKYTQSGQEIDYEQAVVSVEYGYPGDSESGDDAPMDPVNLYSETLEPYSRFITLPPDQFMWSSDSKPLVDGEEPGRVVHGIRFVRTLFQLPSIDNSILDLPGSVHNKSFTSTLMGKTFATGTLLIIPPTMSRTVTTAGSDGWNLKLGWDYNKNTWNKLWRLDNGVYDRIRHKGGGLVDLFEEKDHGAFLF